MKNDEIATSLVRLGRLLEYKGENWFKISAYYRVAELIQKFSGDVAIMVQEQRLREIPGVGEAIARKITELLTSGKLQKYEQEKQGIPEDILLLLEQSPINPTRLRKLVTNYKATTLTALAKLTEQENTRDDLSLAELLNSINLVRNREGRML